MSMFVQAKTYYLCGVALRSVSNLVKKSKNKCNLAALSNFTVDGKVAAMHGLPTRHVTMKTRGGLTYACKRYYEVFSKMEDRFFCTVRFCVQKHMHMHMRPHPHSHLTTWPRWRFPRLTPHIYLFICNKSTCTCTCAHTFICLFAKAHAHAHAPSPSLTLDHLAALARPSPSPLTFICLFAKAHAHAHAPTP